MSSAFRKAAKSGQRPHRERAQPAARRKLGLLEKKKDYRLRADDYHKKQNALRALHKKALDKNPDEFYFKMIRTELQDGVHKIKQPKDEVTPEQVKLMRTQDIKYVEMKRVAEAKKIERLKSELHLLDAEGKNPNQHVFFFDTKKEVQEFDIATHLDTVPELVDRVYNRPTIATLQKETLKGATDPAHLKKLAQQRKNQYDLLKQRIEREKAMFVIAQKIQTRKDLLDKDSPLKWCSQVFSKILLPSLKY
ncbi:probable U3 small nucleolar RNA-associated protein 11 isoform X2 [Falco naumanni]|uniref:probable U3 small nucleolar RNA-associated protein 11 isoform X2 n=1 Tax=Falco naumanni TaxID=148594 RepID=UPI001ADE7762|nr:probable U3 small nucleolar RNA-associated protein 11 isoform X2 [Falco naumanni]